MHDSGKSFHGIADEASADLLKEHDQPIGGEPDAPPKQKEASGARVERIAAALAILTSGKPRSSQAGLSHTTAESTGGSACLTIWLVCE